VLPYWTLAITVPTLIIVIWRMIVTGRKQQTAELSPVEQQRRALERLTKK
jgi:hypothetical protein